MNIITRNIPNTITCMNLSAGVMAILCAAMGDKTLWGMEAYNWAYIFIGIAAVADFLDGFAARLLHAYSELGKQLDSLCDMVSFGVAPAVIMYYCLETLGEPAWTRWLVFLIPVCGALRLAKFNIDTRQSTSFIGLPIPANAIFWIGYSALCYAGSPSLAQWFWVIPAIVIESWLMVSPIHLFSLKFKTWGWKENQWRWLLILTAVFLIFCMGVPGLMWLILVYVAYGIFASNEK
ncbi:MAG: CDP-diacylglycerol--serine O-phosphatidyltransferase [Bacteroidales bacterium]|nr:CDP-diacylglycerol--serine O-phosphatidyltransferase [Bacteroidales bacterium]MBD5204871.1 CDP-diacylglycerol--serine O-phosphatidyltransferase [Bacteroidales bacterium]MBD5223077.1 CDP-diacylglycerol--serine O-phosphatidyltransferase [Bacteroidales bacterium]